MIVHVILTQTQMETTCTRITNNGSVHYTYISPGLCWLSYRAARVWSITILWPWNVICVHLCTFLSSVMLQTSIVTRIRNWGRRWSWQMGMLQQKCKCYNNIMLLSKKGCEVLQKGHYDSFIKPCLQRMLQNMHMYILICI